MGRGREAGHVQADLGDDHRGRGGTDPGDLIQAGHRGGERGDLGLDLGFEVGDVRVQGVDADRAGDHDRDQRRDLQVRVKASARHAVRIIEEPRGRSETEKPAASRCPSVG